MSEAENIRLAIASQPTIEQGIAGLLRALATIIREAFADGGSETSLNTLAELQQSIDQNPKHWSDAILANTVSAMLTAGNMAPVPTYVADKFASHGDGGYREPPTAPPHDEAKPDKPAKADKS
jgi:hypothetical protein